MTRLIESSTLCILHPNGKIVGTGFLVGPHLAVTSAHVVVAANAIAGDTVQVQFSGQAEKSSALVEPKYWRDVDKGDVAFLRLDSVPAGTEPLHLGPAHSCRPGNAFRSFGYAIAADVQGIHANGTIDGYLPQHKILQLQSSQANHGMSGGPVFDEARGVVVGMITKGHVKLGRNEQTTFATPTELLFEICPKIQPAETCPYRGLEAFTAETAQFFFGREALIEKLLTNLLKGCRFLAVLGPSGSGKSSVVRAGLLPKLERGPFADWRQITMRPAEDPFEQLKATGLESLSNVPERIILFIDQFEELFTLCADGQRVEFVAVLATALENSRFMLILSMRDDFYSAFNAKAAALAQSDHLKIENVPGVLKPGELVDMIKCPIAKVGLALEEGLTEYIIKDLTREGEARSSTLPLLEFALSQLWEQRRDSWLTHDAYHAIGEVTGSLARWADEAYSDLPKIDQSLAESLIISLVHPGDESQSLPDTRRRQTLAEFDEPALRVVKHFTDRRLLVTEGETVELVHDALLREWDRLRGWLNKDRDNLRLREGVSDDARQWHNASRHESLLNHRGARLGMAMEMSKNPRYRLTSVEQAYLDGCVDLQERDKAAAARRRKYAIAGISAALGVIMAILIGWGWTSNENSKLLSNQVSTADAAKATAIGEANVRATAQAEAEVQKAEAERQAKIAIARQLVSQVQSANMRFNSKQMVSTLLYIQSMKLFPNGEVADYLINTDKAALLAARMVHESSVKSVVFSPDGKYVVSGSGDKTVRVWEAASGREVARLTHDGSVNSVAFSSDGQYVVSGSDDKTARVWEATSGKEVARITHEQEVFTVAFSPDGKYVVSGSGDRTARVWDVANGREISRMTHDGRVWSIAFSPDGKYVVSGSWDGTARVWEAASGKEIARMTYTYAVNSVGFSPDGQYVVSGNRDGTARVWKVASGKEVARMMHDGSVWSVVFSPDGKYVVSGGDKTARVWEAASGREVARMTHDVAVNSVAFSPDGKYVASGSGDKTARVWEAASGREVARMTYEQVFSVAFSPDGKYVVSGSVDGTVLVGVVASEKEISRMTHDGKVFSMAFSPNGKYVVSGSGDRTARVWEVASGKEVVRMAHESAVNSVAFSPDGRYVVSGSTDGTVRAWEAASGKEIAHMIYESAVNSVAFSPDGQYVALGNVGGIALVWDVVSGKEVARIIHNGSVNSVAFSSDGQYVVSGSDDKTIRVWEATSGKEVARIAHDSNVHSVIFSPEAKYIMSGSWDKTARIWEVMSGKETHRLTHDDRVWSVAFSPDGKYAVSGSVDGTARMWEVASGKEIARMTHDNAVFSVAFSPDGQYVVSAGADGITRVWEAMSGKEITRIPHDDIVNFVAFSPNGKYVASGSSDKTVRVRIYRPEDLVAAACSRVTRNLSRAEWQQYIGDMFPYQAVCPNLPVEPEPIAMPTP